MLYVRRWYPHHIIQTFWLDVRGYQWASVAGQYCLNLTVLGGNGEILFLKNPVIR